MTEPTTIRPTININGTSRADLIEPRLKAYRLIEDAVKALRQVTPNGRDYPGDNDRCCADRELHYDRLRALNGIADALMLEAMFIKTGED